MTESGSRARGWQLVVPVKDPLFGKQRLGLGVREKWATAFALDTLRAARAAACVEVVHLVSTVRFGVVVDRHAEVGAPVRLVADAPSGLNEAISFAVEGMGRRSPGVPTAVLLGDLPALRPDELERALGVARGCSVSFVRDADGTGSTLLTAVDVRDLVPAFGPDSAAAHLVGGAAEILDEGLDGLRRDVDSVATLRRAARLGVGRSTRSLLDAPEYRLQDTGGGAAR